MIIDHRDQLTCGHNEKKKNLNKVRSVRADLKLVLLCILSKIYLIKPESN